MAGFKKLTSDVDSDLNKVQQNVQRTVSPILDSEIVDGLQLDDIELSTGSNVIDHKLGRALRGYIVVRKSANVTIFDTQVTKTVLKLTSSGAATISLWVY